MMMSRISLAPAMLSLAMLPMAGTAAAAEKAESDDVKAVRAALDGFYAALQMIFEGDVEPMDAVWSHADDVTYMGPDGGFQVGWKQVRADWEAQADLELGGDVNPADVRIVVGETVAVVSNVEKGQNLDRTGKIRKVDIRATSVFRKEQGRWKMIGHHTDKLPFLVK